MSQLTEDELASLEAFFRFHQGQIGSFSFYDPWDDIVYDDCSFENKELLARSLEIGDCRLVLRVRQN
jgi:hypothetical protein